MPWLHDLDALRGWARHPDANVRRWAVSRWTTRYPRTDLVGLATLLVDYDREVRRDVALHLARSGETRWAAVLVKALQLAQGRDRLPIIEALGLLGQPSAVPSLTDALRQIHSASGARELVALVQALGQHRTEGAWRAVAPLLDRVHDDDPFTATLVRAVLGLGRRDDVPLLVQRWRGWSDTGQEAVAAAFLDWLGADGVVADRCSRLPDRGVETVLALCATDRAALLPPPLVDPLIEGWVSSPLAFLRACHRQCVHLLTARRDDIAAWMDDVIDVPSRDYRALAIGVEALLGALAAHAPVDERAGVECRLALTALLTLSMGEHAARSLAAARDPVATAWRLFRAPRPGLAPVVRELLVSQRQRAVGPLAELLMSDVADAVLIRAASLVGDLVAQGADARPLIEPLADLLQRRTGEVARAAGDALVAAGPASGAALAARLDEDAHDELIETLGRLDTEESVVALGELLRGSVAVDLRVVEALADTGDVRVIDWLAPMWSGGDAPLAVLLESLCAMHGVDHPARALWRRDGGTVVMPPPTVSAAGVVADS